MIYRQINGTNYKQETLQGVIDVLEEARLKKIRITIKYGDVKTQMPWRIDLKCGYVGRTNHTLLPILLLSRHSEGGECIMDSSILEIRECRTGKYLFQYPNDF